MSRIVRPLAGPIRGALGVPARSGTGRFPRGEEIFLVTGTFIVPENVNTISMVVIGAGGGGAGTSTVSDPIFISGGGGGGAALAFNNSVQVFPGEA